MQNEISNIRYNKMLYDSKPVRFDEFITNKYDKIHHQLYEDALQKFILSLGDESCKTIRDFKKKYNIIEFKNDEYWQPSSIVYITKTYPFKKHRVDLTEYWNFYQEHKDDVFTNIKFFEENQDVSNFELINIDYIKGLVQLRDKLNFREFWVPFNKINKNIEVGEDYSLANLFSSKINF